MTLPVIHAQVIVPWRTVPFLSSIVTVSLLSFIKNLLSGAASVASGTQAAYAGRGVELARARRPTHLTSFILEAESDAARLC